MAIVDHELQFSRAQALTATAASTNQVDLGYEEGDAGTGETQYLVVTARVANDEGTVQVSLRESDAENMSSPRVIAQSAAVNLQPGVPVILPVPPHAGRYLDVNYTIAGGKTATVDAGLQLDVQRWKAYQAKPDE